MMHNLESRFADFIRKHINVIIIVVISLLGFYLRYSMLPYKSIDYKVWLQPWFYQLSQNGHLAALGQNIGNYTPPYLTILALLTYIPVNPIYSIKFVSILFDFILAATAACIVRQISFGSSKKINFPSIVTYSTILLLPTVCLNSAYWSQCDSIYVSFILLFVLFMVKKRYIIAFLFFGLAFAFKLQTVFALPAILIYYFLDRKFSIKYFLMIPATMFAAILPAVVNGRPIVEVLKIYPGQISSTLDLYVYPNISYLLKNADAKIFTPVFLSLTIAVLFFGFAFMLYKNFQPKSKDIITIFLWCAYACVLFLPGMHERYGYLFEILSVVYVVLNKKHWYLAVGANFIGFLAYFPFLFKTTQINFIFLSIVNICMFIFFSYQCVQALSHQTNKEAQEAS
jgi:Predicted integral membrane protein